MHPYWFIVCSGKSNWQAFDGDYCTYAEQLFSYLVITSTASIFPTWKNTWQAKAWAWSWSVYHLFNSLDCKWSIHYWSIPSMIKDRLYIFFNPSSVCSDHVKLWRDSYMYLVDICCKYLMAKNNSIWWIVKVMAIECRFFWFILKNKLHAGCIYPWRHQSNLQCRPHFFEHKADFLSDSFLQPMLRWLN